MKNEHIYTIEQNSISVSNPKPDDITVNVIAAGLSRQPRWVGQTPEHYSVAQHSVLVALIAPSHLFREALYHDATEAFLCDLPSSIKHLPQLQGYRELERKWDAAISDAFQLSRRPSDVAAVKECDLIVNDQEARTFFPRLHPSRFQQGLEIRPWSQDDAYQLFHRLANYRTRPEWLQDAVNKLNQKYLLSTVNNYDFFEKRMIYTR